MNALHAITTEHGLKLLNSDLKKAVTQYRLIGALTHDASSELLYRFYEAQIETSYFDKNGILSFELNLPIEMHFEEYLHQIHVMDADGQNVISCETPKVALIKGVGGMVTLKADITGEAGDVVFKHGEYITQTELHELYLPPLLAEKEDKSNAASDDDIDAQSTKEKHIKLPQLWRALAPSRLVDKLWLEIAAKIFPVGAAIPWFSDIVPAGFAMMNGQKFDLNACPHLAAIFSNGILPDMRGCALVGKEASETVGVYEEGQIKSHGHNVTIASTNLGTKTTSSTSLRELNRIQNSIGSYVIDNTQTLPSAGWTSYMCTGDTNNNNSDVRMRFEGKSVSHNHTVAIGSHSHTATVTTTGQTKNTMNHRKVNWIVRLA